MPESPPRPSKRISRRRFADATHRAGPLDFEYRSYSPFRTLARLIDDPWTHHVSMLFWLVIKHAPWYAVPLFTGYLIDALAKPEEYDFQRVWLYGIITALFVLQNIPSHTRFMTLVSRTIRKIERNLRTALVQRLQQLSIAFHNANETGRLQTKVLRDVESIEMLYRQIIQSGIPAIGNVLFAVVTGLYKMPIMALFYILVAPICVGLIRVFRNTMRERNREFRSGIEDMSAQVNEMLDMIEVSRAHAVEDKELSRLQDRLETVRARGVELDRLNAVFGASSWVTFTEFRLLSLAIGGYYCYQGQLSIGDLVLFGFLFEQLVGGINQLLSVYPIITKGFDAIRSLGEILECPDIEHNTGKRTVGELEGRFAFEDVTFTYEHGEGKALRDFSCTIEPGECIAVVGESGAGKSTLMNLIIGFWRPSKGRMLLDGIDMEELDLRSYRRQLSVVPQTTLLFSGTIRENIVHGLDRVDEDFLREVVEAANVAEFADKLPDGLDTMLGEGGARLSGGQKQRVAIARALMRDPAVLILDEATSALDVASEKLVQEAIDRLIQGRTTFIVAHRLSTIRNADRILVLREGHLLESGPHDELMALRGEYFRLRSLQG